MILESEFDEHGLLNIHFKNDDSIKIIDDGNDIDYEGKIRELVLSTNHSCISELTFNDSIEIESMTIPNEITSIKQIKFHDCVALRSLSISDYTHVYKVEFVNCISLESIILGNRSLDHPDIILEDCMWPISLIVGEVKYEIFNEKELKLYLRRKHIQKGFKSEKKPFNPEGLKEYNEKV